MQDSKTKAIIIHKGENLKLLRFSQISCFFEPWVFGLKGIKVFDDCVIVENIEQAEKIKNNQDIIMKAGEQYYKGEVKPFDTKTLLKYYRQINRDKKMLYVDQTEEMGLKYFPKCNKFYGVASGWKAMLHCVEHKYDYIKIFDKNERQLELAKKLHSLPNLPDEIQVDWPYSANGFKPTEHLKNKWRFWHELDVQFEQIDILEEASFPYDSLIWVSNIFDYHTNIFDYGYEKLKKIKQQFIFDNQNSVVIDDIGILK